MWDRHRSRLVRAATAILALAVVAGLVELSPSALSSTMPARPAGSVVLSRQRPGRQLSFASLGSFKPAASEVFGEGTLSVNPGRPNVVAWCGEGYVSIQDGRSVLHLPTAAALKAIARWLRGRAGRVRDLLSPGCSRHWARTSLRRLRTLARLRRPPHAAGHQRFVRPLHRRLRQDVVLRARARGTSELSFGRFSYGHCGQGTGELLIRARCALQGHC